MATLTHTRGDTLPLVLPLPADATAATLQIHAARSCVEIDGTVNRSRAYFAPTAADGLPPGRVYRTTARTTRADGTTQTIDSFALLILEGCGDASPAPSGIILSGALVEAGADTASGSLSIVAPGAITLSAALTELGADTASGEMTVGAAPITYSDDTTAVTALWTGYAADDFTASVVLPADDTIQLAVSASPDLSSPIFGAPVATVGGYAKPTISGLQRGTEYHYGIRKGDTVYRALKGKFRTLPAPGPTSFRFGFGNCNADSVSSAFVGMDAADPLFVLHLGDIHYGDINVDDPAPYHAALDSRFSNDLGALMRSRPLIYMYDDHDFCGNTSDASSVGRQAVMSVYNQRVPTPPRAFTGPDDPVGFRFVVGRIRFIVPDGRSRKVSGGSMWGAEQKQWIFSEITGAKSAGQFVCLCINISWYYFEFPSSDRRELGNHVAAQGMEGRVFAIGGDAHSIQIDDGSNHQLASVGSARIPTIHAGPFGQTNSTKGGPWSHGTHIKSQRQGGYIDVTDNGGDEIDLTFTGYRDNGVVVVTYAFKLSLLGFPDADSYAITPSSSTVNEGAAVTFSITSNRPNTTVNVLLSGVSATDIVGGSLSNQVALGADGSGSLTVTITEDAITEGVEMLTATVGGTSITTSVQIEDTSTAPPPSGNAPLIVQQAVGHAPGVDGGTTPTLATLPTPATAGNLIVLFVMSDKIATDYVVPAGFVQQAAHLTGTGVSGAIYTKIASGGEREISVRATSKGQIYNNILALETTASLIDAAAIGTERVGSASRGTSVTAPAVSSDTLAFVTWHNDSAVNSVAGANPQLSTGWTVIAASGIGPNFPELSGHSNAPGWIAASQNVATAGPLSASFAYEGSSGDENMMMLVTLKKGA